MKINFNQLLGLLLLAFTLHACQGNEENEGNPELCYFLLSYDVSDCGDCCNPGDFLGFNLNFCDELGNTFTFGPYTVPTPNDQLLALPSGHSYTAHIVNNGNSSGCSSIPGLDITIFGSTNEEVCTIFSTSIDGRPEAWDCSASPDLSFELDAVCDGCASTNLPQIDCCEATAFGFQEQIGEGTFGDLIVDVLNGDNCVQSVAEICVKADNGTTWTDFNSTAGCVNNFQSNFSFYSTGAPILVEVKISYNNGCPDEVIYYTIPGV